MTDKNNIEAFSFEMKEFDDDSLTLEQTYLQTRFYAIQAVNMDLSGEKALTPEAKKAIRVYNRYCRRVGQEPIKGDFR